MSNEGPKPARARLLVDITPLRESPAFARLWTGTLVAGFGMQLTLVAVGLQVYDLTHSTLAVSMVGVFGLVPLILAGLYGGMLTDAYDRRTVLLIFSLIAWASSIGLAIFAWFHGTAVWLLYVLTVLNSVAAAVVSIARAAVVPRLVRPELLPAASALGGISMGLFITVGPALGGILVATVGFAWTYTADVALFLAALAAAFTLPSLKPEGERHAPGLESIRTGLAFLKRAPVIRASFLVDIAAMTLGRPNSLFPAVGAIVLGGGATTVGALTASFAVGGLALSAFSGRLLGIQRQGVVVGWSIATYALGILGFGLVLLISGIRAEGSPVLTIGLGCALFAVFVCGASDQLSAIFRTTILQTAAPDNMLGRLQGIFIVVVNGGPRLGDLFVGVLTAIGTLWLPPVLGGVLLLIVIALMMRSYSDFRTYRAVTSTSH